MKYTAQFPYIKVYSDSKNHVRYVWRSSTSKHGMYRSALALSQDGMQYTADNIDGLLLARHTAKKIRNAGGRLKGPAKRTAAQDRAFSEKLLELLRR